MKILGMDSGICGGAVVELNDGVVPRDS